MSDITAYRKRYEEMDQEELDEEVHGAKAAEAAEINNQGREAQIAYLMGEDDKVTFDGPTLSGGALVFDSDTFKTD
jgi:hypothetical protein